MTDETRGSLDSKPSDDGSPRNVLRTPEERFAEFEGFAFAPNYANVDGLRMHYVDAGPREASPVVLLHGEPSWCYLYRKMIPILAEAGHRVIAPDLIGFGRSDKPADRSAHTYARHVAWMRALLLDHLDLVDITLFVQDWGGLIGLRVAAQEPDRFARIVAANTFLPVGRETSEAFEKWQRFSQEVPEFPVGAVLQRGTVVDLPGDVLAAYEAPFPDESYKAGPRALPAMVPTAPDDPEAQANRTAWRVLSGWEKPFLTLFGAEDPITAGAENVFQQRIPGASGQPHHVFPDTGHFLQEDRGPEIAHRIIRFMDETAVDDSG
jgi:haloalkane dehalogenase